MLLSIACWIVSRLDPEKLAAFIALTPATANAYGPSTFSQVLVPTLYVYGSKDKNTGKRFSELFEQMPNCEIMQLEGSNHFYTDYPDKWHESLSDFLQRLTSVRTGQWYNFIP